MARCDRTATDRRRDRVGRLFMAGSSRGWSCCDRRAGRRAADVSRAADRGAAGGARSGRRAAGAADAAGRNAATADEDIDAAPEGPDDQAEGADTAESRDGRPRRRRPVRRPKPTTPQPTAGGGATGGREPTSRPSTRRGSTSRIRGTRQHVSQILRQFRANERAHSPPTCTSSSARRNGRSGSIVREPRATTRSISRRSARSRPRPTQRVRPLPAGFREDILPVTFRFPSVFEMTRFLRVAARAFALRPLGRSAAAQDTTYRGITSWHVRSAPRQDGIVVLPVGGAFGDSIRAIVPRDLDYSDRFTVIPVDSVDPRAASGDAAGSTIRPSLGSARRRSSRSRPCPRDCTSRCMTWRAQVVNVSSFRCRPRA